MRLYSKGIQSDTKEDQWSSTTSAVTNDTTTLKPKGCLVENSTDVEGKSEAAQHIQLEYGMREI